MSDQKPVTEEKKKEEPLSETQMAELSGGLNPQPLPPGDKEPS